MATRIETIYECDKCGSTSDVLTITVGTAKPGERPELLEADLCGKCRKGIENAAGALEAWFHSPAITMTRTQIPPAPRRTRKARKS